MATLALTSAGSIAGSALLPSGLSAFGATISGAAIGQAIGAVAGNYIDEALFASSGQSRIVEGARLSDLQIVASSEGTTIPRLYGRARLGGQIIWATQLIEEIVKNTQSSGGGKFSQSKTTTQISYEYFGNLAVGLCEGKINRIGRIWADGKELNLSDFTYRLYKGSEDQMPDSLIEAKEGAGKAPAYRGLAYIVFEHMPLERFGNRIPQLNFEIFRSVDGFAETIKAVTIIPGAGEYAYSPGEVIRTENVTTVPENIHTKQGGSDWTVSMNDLQDSLPNVQNGALVVSWFGTDLRVEHCELRPGIENREKQSSMVWNVAGENRQTAHLVSTKDGRPAFGGTPDDASIIASIQDMQARGIGVTFYPFILMDIADNNILPDPYTGNTGQPVYPWRGRITVEPAPGISGTPDKTSSASTQLFDFIGSASVSDFSIVNNQVVYTGPNEWSYRRMILHYAHLCKAAGGVDSFLLGSELKGLTQIRDSASNYPFVNALVQLASDVKAILGSFTKVTYAADWSEYYGHHPDDGSGDVYFHLDPLWSSSDIDAIGIDVYWPLSDWREGINHLDYQDGTRSIYDLEYLKKNISAGEGYDWYYLDEADRVAQSRADITDGLGKPWVFRYKDILSWWQNAHYNRPGGIEHAIATSWVPQSKPIWFTEVGCPAVDKGANQPNVFYDPKSSESFFPYFSNGTRDDTIQRRYIQAFHEYYDPDHETYSGGSNPVSTVYNGRMVDVSKMYVYSWDARPYPAFPLNSNVWGDAQNWVYGHWITGRMGDAPLAETVKQILIDYSFTDFDVSKLYGILQGFVIDRIMSARDSLQPLELSFFLDTYESDGKIKFKHRGHDGVVLAFSQDQLVDTGVNNSLYDLKRKQETELSSAVKLTYINADNDYSQASAEARRLTVQSDNVATAQLPVVLDNAQMQSNAEIWLHDIWSSREESRFALPPSRIALEPTDLVSLQTQENDKTIRLTELADGEYRNSLGLTIEPSVYNAIRTPARTGSQATPNSFGQSTAIFMNLPMLNEEDNPEAGYVAAYQDPWPGGVALYRSSDDSRYTINTIVSVPAVIGETLNGFVSGPTSHWDLGNQLEVQLINGELSSVNELDLLNGSNLAAIETEPDQWEVFQFQNAELISDKAYRLSGFLRGQSGTEHMIVPVVAAGTRFVLLDEAIAQVDMSNNDIAKPFYWRYGPVNRNIDHKSYQSITHSFSGKGYQPYSPVHISSKRYGNDIEISWVRRTRTGGDNWELPEVPLGEVAERYEIDILDGENTIRTISTESPNAIYSEADQIMDWSAIQSSYNVRIVQIGGITGRGAPVIGIIGG